MEKQACGPARSLTKAGPKMAAVCRYLSANCAARSGKCGEGYNARWLDGENSKAICVLSPKRTSGDEPRSKVAR